MASSPFVFNIDTMVSSKQMLMKIIDEARAEEWCAVGASSSEEVVGENEDEGKGAR